MASNLHQAFGWTAQIPQAFIFSIFPSDNKSDVGTAEPGCASEKSGRLIIQY
jgi:hypothetical protein